MSELDLLEKQLDSLNKELRSYELKKNIYEVKVDKFSLKPPVPFEIKQEMQEAPPSNVIVKRKVDVTMILVDDSNSTNLTNSPVNEKMMKSMKTITGKDATQIANMSSSSSSIKKKRSFPKGRRLGSSAEINNLKAQKRAQEDSERSQELVAEKLKQVLENHSNRTVKQQFMLNAIIEEMAIQEKTLQENALEGRSNIFLLTDNVAFQKLKSLIGGSSIKDNAIRNGLFTWVAGHVFDLIHKNKKKENRNHSSNNEDEENSSLGNMINKMFGQTTKKVDEEIFDVFKQFFVIGLILEILVSKNAVGKKKKKGGKMVNETIGKKTKDVVIGPSNSSNSMLDPFWTQINFFRNLLGKNYFIVVFMFFFILFFLVIVTRPESEVESAIEAVQNFFVQNFYSKSDNTFEKETNVVKDVYKETKKKAEFK